ncbi:hypothetical protein HDV00_001832 [Rhizophlyctis rosea]|nr:hypothetical protein HDV00_001832 [Rhizophlyctis rosea]
MIPEDIIRKPSSPDASTTPISAPSLTLAPTNPPSSQPILVLPFLSDLNLIPEDENDPPPDSEAPRDSDLDSADSISNASYSENYLSDPFHQSSETISSHAATDYLSDEDIARRPKVFAKVQTWWSAAEYKELQQRARRARMLRERDRHKGRHPEEEGDRKPPAFSTPIKIHRPKEELIIQSTKYKKPLSSLENLVREPQHSFRHEMGLYRSARSRVSVGPWLGKSTRSSPRVMTGREIGSLDGRESEVRGGSGSVYAQESQPRVVGGSLV